jgi:hypothetical protein
MMRSRCRPAGVQRQYTGPAGKDLVLTAGEVAEFDTHLPHWFGNADPQPVEYLSILGPQGERFHVRARYRPS